MMSPDVTRRADLSMAAPMQWGAAGVSTPQQAFVLPVGTVTFLLTDVAGSTSMWERESAEDMRTAIMRHYEILSEAVDANGGVRPQEQGEGDSIVAAFARPSEALAAASAAQLALAAERWPTTSPVRVRMAIHTGEANLRDDANYAGQSIIRTARLRNIGHGGQVLVSGATRDLAVDQARNRFVLRSLGEHRLRDLGRPEHVWQLVVPDLPDDFGELATLDSMPNSLPVSLSPFIGREAEIATLAGLVASERLVTVTGTGGAGKTRLAQQVGAELLDRFPAGVWWVELAPLDGGGVEPAIRAALGLSEGAQAPPLAEGVRRKLGGEPCLLVVDNCEHVSAAVQAIIDDLLRHAATLHVLATSRVMLDLPGEHAWRVPPLALPDPAAAPSVESLSQFDAVRLFCDRAQRARPNFALTTENGPAVAQICRRLDGIPFAIELAAARCRMLDPQRILLELDDAFRILAGGSTALMPRQQTLDASITWSYDLLSSTEQALLRRLSVFVDGWTLDAAEAVCPDPEGTLGTIAVFDALDRLVDHSLVHATDTESGLRFGMLETIRQYALRQLDTDPTERDATHRRHSEHFTSWALSHRDQILRGGSDTLLEFIDAERSNLVAATEVATTNGEASLAIHALAAVAPVMELTSWAPMSTIFLNLLDRIEAVAEMEDEWLVHQVRSALHALRGDVMSQLGAFEDMQRAAESADQRIGVQIARFATLTIFAAGGAPIFDELLDAVAEMEGLDPTWGAIARSHLALSAAYQGRLGLFDLVISEIDRGEVVLNSWGGRDLMEGMVCFARGDSVAASESFTSALASRYRPFGTTGIAESFLALASADLGVDLTAAPEERFRLSFEVDGNIMGGLSADWMLAIHHLLTDDIEAARCAMRRSLDRSMATGMAGTGPNERYALVAAGIDDFDDVITADGGPTTTSSNLRAQAEQHLRRGDTGEALSLAHQALDVGSAEGALRSTAFTLECISRILAAAAHHTEAARLLGACDAFRTQRASIRYPCLQRLLDLSAGTSRDALGDEEFDAAVGEGATLPLEAAADYCRRLRVAHNTTRVGWDALTPTEARVAELVAEGLSNPQVAAELLMGTETVKTHLSRVFDKVGVSNRKELIVAASRRAAERHR